MFRSLFIALVATLLIASVASAAPQSLLKGHWSLGYSPSGAQEFLLGIGIADMSKIVASASFENVNPGDTVTGGQTTPGGDSNTAWSVGAAYHYYVDGLSTEGFAPFVGGGFRYSDTGVSGEDGSFAFDGRFGGEAFPIEALSIGGFVGVQYMKEGDVTEGDTTEKGDTEITSFRSSIFATLYWGG